MPRMPAQFISIFLIKLWTLTEWRFPGKSIGKCIPILTSQPNVYFHQRENVNDYEWRWSCHGHIPFLKEKAMNVFGMAKQRNTFKPNFPIKAMTLVSRTLSTKWEHLALGGQRLVCWESVAKSWLRSMSFRQQKTHTVVCRRRQWTASCQPIRYTKYPSKLRVCRWILIDIFEWYVTPRNSCLSMRETTY